MFFLILRCKVTSFVFAIKEGNPATDAKQTVVDLKNFVNNEQLYQIKVLNKCCDLARVYKAARDPLLEADQILRRGPLAGVRDTGFTSARCWYHKVGSSTGNPTQDFPCLASLP